MPFTPIAKATGIIKVDNLAGTLTDITGVAMSFTIEIDTGKGRFFVMDSDWSLSTIGKSGWQVTARIYKSLLSTEGYMILRDWFTGATKRIPRSIQIDSPTSAIGSERWAGEVNLTNMTPLVDGDASSNDPQMVTITFEGHGALTPSTIAS